jgi:hypothetical protein
MSTIRGYNSAGGIPTYNPEPKQKVVTSPTTAPISNSLLHFPSIFLDNRPNGTAGNSQDENQDVGYLLPKSRDGVRNLQGSTDNIVEVLDSYKLIDPLTAQHMLIEDGASPYRGHNSHQILDDYNNTLSQIRHAQHHSITLSHDQSLRGLDNSAIKIKQRGQDKCENLAAQPTINSLFPAFDSTQQYISGECSLPPRRFQLFLQVNVCIFAVNEWTELYFSLYSTTQDRYVTEDYVVRLPPPGLPEHAAILGRMKTVFRDLSPEDLKSDLWLVCRIYRNGSLLVDKKAESQAMSAKKDDKKKGAETVVRRCFGCAATYISQANLTSQIGKKYEPPPNQLTIYVPTQEVNFAGFHKSLIQRAKGLLRDSKEFDTVPRAKGIALSLTLFEGEITQVREQQRSALREVGDTMKLLCPLYWDIRLPRTELLINISGCSALQDKKAAEKNIEIRVKLVRNADYQDVSTAIFRGNGNGDEEPIPLFTTSVYYHTNTPTFNETFKIRCPPQVLQESHLFFEMWHISTNPKKSTCFSTTHFCITTPSKNNGPPRFIPDQEHTITTSKPYAPSDSYLSPSQAIKLQQRKGETITFSTQLLSTSLTSQATLAELRNWQTCSQQRCTHLLQGLTLTSRSPPLAATTAPPQQSLGSFGSPSLMMGGVGALGGDEPLHYIQPKHLRQNLQELLNTFLAIFSANDRIALHGVAFDSYVHILARLALEANPMLELYVSQLIRSEYIGAVWRLLGFTVGALEYHQHFVITSVEAINSVGTLPAPNPGSLQANQSNAEPGSRVPPTPSHSGRHDSFKEERRPSSIPQFTLMGSETPSKLNSGAQPPQTPLHRGAGGVPALDFDLDNNHSSSNQNANQNKPSAISGDLNSDDLTPLQRFALALPFLVRIITSLYSYFERTNQARSSVSGFTRGPNTEITAQQTGGSTPYVQFPPEGLARPDFKARIVEILEKVNTILAQPVSNEQAKAIQISQSVLLRSYPDLLSSLSLNNPISTLSQLFSTDELYSAITRLLTAITPNNSLHTQHILTIKTFLTGIVGMTTTATDAMNTPVPVLHQLDTKNVHSPTSIGWHRHTTSGLRSWLLTPKQHRQSALPTPVLKALLPQFLTSLQSIVSTSLYRGSLNETIIAVPIVEHIYSIIFAANTLPTDVSASYVQDLTEYYFTGSKFAAANTEMGVVDKLDISNKSPAEIFPPSEYLTLLPTLITILYHYIALYPKIELPKSDITHHGFNLPDWKVINSAFVDILPQTSLLIFSIFSLASKQDIIAYFSSLPREQSSALLSQLLYACNGFTTFAIVPRQWLDLDVFQRLSIIGIVRITSAIMLESFNSDDDFSPFLWVYWLQLALSCKGPDFFNIQGSTLRAGHVNSKIDRSSVERELIELFHVMWNALSPQHKVTTCPVLVERLIAIISSPLSDDGYKQLALTIYYQLLESEYETTESFSLVERYTIDSLYEVANISPDRAHAAMDKMYNITWGQFDSLMLSDPNNAKAAALCKEGRRFLDHLKNLFTLMSSLFTHPSDPEWEYDRTAVALRLIRYIETSSNKTRKKDEPSLPQNDPETASSSSTTLVENKNNDDDDDVDNAVQTRKAMHTRYIQYLVDLHVDHRNFAEAGISYIQQAKQLDWTNIMLDGSGNDFQAETESERKLRLLDNAIDMLSKAHDYERCIQLIDYLRYYYQHISFNFSALAKQIQRQANFFNAMITTTRVYSTYYRVVLYGRAAQDALQSTGNQLSNTNHSPENGIEFVYKGNTLEGISLFTDRLKKRFTDAFFHMSSEKPSPELMAQHKSIVAVVALVVPPADVRSEVLSSCPEARRQYEQSQLSQDPTMISWNWPQSNAAQASMVNNAYTLGSGAVMPLDTHAVSHIYPEPQTIVNYRTNNRIYVLEYSKPWRRSEDKKPANEFLDLWLVRTYLIVEEPFPANRRRIEVIARVEKVQKPIQNAIETIQNKTKELSTLIQEVMATPVGEIADCRKLSMNLNGMIDAAVNGGNAKYIEAFLNSTFATPDAVIYDNEKVDIAATLQERRRCQQELKTALKQQFALLKEGVSVFARKADSSQLGLIQHLRQTHETTTTKLASILD